LPAAVVPVAVGTACAAGAGGVEFWRAAAALVVSLALQVAVNYANDYSDGVKGTDDVRVGPVRLVASKLATPAAVKRAAFASMGVAAVAGVALAWAVGPQIVVVGVVSMLAAWGYTGGPKPYGYLGLGEVFVFVFFGVVATVGTTYVQLERVTGLAVAASVPVGMLACALLVVNNLRDIPTDTVAGKRTLAVRLGDGRTRWLYAALMFGAIAGGAGCALARPGALVVVFVVLLAAGPVTLVRQGATGRALIAVLGATGRVQLAFGALFSLGLWLTA
jgi:1,4-dihydroxy-2-naphthoate octaprenyltransferase